MLDLNDHHWLGGVLVVQIEVVAFPVSKLEKSYIQA